MSILYKIVPDQKTAYIKAWGKVTVDEVMIEGEKMFAETEWENGFNILCDYREITEFNPSVESIRKIVYQDKKNDPLLDKTKCAVVSKSDLIFGITRMWDILSAETKLSQKVFRNINDAMSWLGLDLDFLDSMNKLP